ncbi:TrbI/VirB10 family protein [Calothrix sp. 336/3]|uniref:TrbI/VirB10 family protein n=1 Tax=Calothrix sp. 336/3 TaxID=1337936 RepID=UPI0004E33641|nr:TrbI/VirB10 family protein [Calothrix sp. 336/3]AKG21346.1 conjugal transfer protein TrbI [Calothrix sp. 336/3]
MPEQEVENNQLNQSWDEASFARLLGLNEENLTEKKTDLSKSDELSGEEVNNQNSVAINELFDDPHLGKTQPTFYGNPFAKFGAVGLVMLVVFGAGATVLNSIMSGKPKVAPIIANRETSKPKVEIADNFQETETGKLKAELALSTQAEKIKSVEHSQNRKPAITRPLTLAKKKNVPPTVAPREITRQQVAYIPRSIPQRVSYQPQRVNYEYPHANYQPRFQPVANKVNSAPIAKPLPKQDDINSIEQWREISSLGSYGSAEITTIPKTNPQLANTSNSDLNEQQIPNIPRATLVSAASNQNQIVPTVDDSNLEPLHDEEALIIENQNTPQLTIGTSASGKLITPIVWANNRSDNTKQPSKQQQTDKFIIQVSQPLKTEDNAIILPKNSQLIVQVKDIQKSGFMELEATRAMIDGNEYVLPEGAIAIRGKSGQPLIASSWGNKGGEIAARDAETFAVGSLAKVGKVLNQPKEEQISTNSGFGGTSSFSSIRRNNSNILGAVLEGGFEPLTQQILQRNQQALQEIQRREDVWFVKAGTEVQVFVNQTFQF